MVRLVVISYASMISRYPAAPVLALVDEVKSARARAAAHDSVAGATIILIDDAHLVFPPQLHDQHHSPVWRSRVHNRHVHCFICGCGLDAYKEMVALMTQFIAFLQGSSSRTLGDVIMCMCDGVTGVAELHDSRDRILFVLVSSMGGGGSCHASVRRQIPHHLTFDVPSPSHRLRILRHFTKSFPLHPSVHRRPCHQPEVDIS